MKTVVITLMSIAAIACGLWLAISGGTGAAATCLSAGVLILLIANINDFEFIKGFGFEARAKKLDDKIREADRLVAQLRDASKILADVSFQLMARAGRWDGVVPKPELLSITDRIAALLKAVGEGKDGIDESMDPLHRMHLGDLGAPILHALNEALRLDVERINAAMAARASEVRNETGGLVSSDDGISAGLEGQWSANQDFGKKLNGEYRSVDRFSLASYLDDALEGLPNINTDAKEKLRRQLQPRFDELRHYTKTREFKDTAVWLVRDYGA